MCRPTDAKVVADAKAAAAPKSTWKKRLALVAAGAAVYFSRARSHAPTPWTPSAKVALPAVEAELEMLSNVPRFVWWKRDGGLRLESVMTVRMLNKKPLPLKMRGANFTNLFAMESSSSGSQSPSPSGGGGGGRQLYEAGWQSLGNFTIPPFGEVTSRYYSSTGRRRARASGREMAAAAREELIGRSPSYTQRWAHTTLSCGPAAR